jgi:hypothetical protein
MSESVTVMHIIMWLRTEWFFGHLYERVCQCGQHTVEIWRILKREQSVDHLQ